MKPGMHIKNRPAESPRRPAVLWLSLLAFAATLALGCGGKQARSDSDLASLNARHFPTLVMAEPEFTFAHGPAEIYLRTHQLVQRLTEGAQIPVIAPWEADVEEGGAWPHGRALLSAVLESNGVGGAGVYVLRFRIEENGTMRRVDAPASFGGATTTRYEPDVTVELRVETLGGRQVARVWYSYEESVYAGEAMDEGELRPMLRDAIHLVASELGAQFASAFPDGPRGALAPLEGVYNARQVFTYGGGAGHSLATQWAELEPEVATVERFRWLRIFAPGLSLEQAQRFDQDPPGVLLTRVSGAVQAAGVRSGDYVVRVGNQPALGEHVLHRFFLSGQRGRSVPIDVLREGSVRRIHVDLGRP